MNNRPLPPNTKRHSEEPSAKKVFSGKRFDVYQWEQEQFDGTKAIYETVKRADSVIIIPVIGDEIVIVREKQPHWEKDGLTLVAGGVNPEEDIAAAAKRELEEETGMVFEKFDLVYIEPVLPAIEWTAYTFIASDYKTTKEKQLDAGERNEVMKISFDKLIELTRERAFFYPPKFVEDFLIRDRVDELKNIFKNPKII
ncbi:MAG: NUDIX domain-containing protein [Patescibacteria group bacterium]